LFEAEEVFIWCIGRVYSRKKRNSFEAKEILYEAEKDFA